MIAWSKGLLAANIVREDEFKEKVSVYWVDRSMDETTLQERLKTIEGFDESYVF